MPALPSKQSRRKSATPITKLQEDDVWRRVLDGLGLEPLSSNRISPAPTTMDSVATEAMASPTAAATPGAKKVTILDLPSETQKDIFKHVSQEGSQRLNHDATMPRLHC
jgi:hypothetical protein